jgi:hypothetical protein
VDELFDDCCPRTLQANSVHILSRVHSITASERFKCTFLRCGQLSRQSRARESGSDVVDVVHGVVGIEHSVVGFVHNVVGVDGGAAHEILFQSLQCVDVAFELYIQRIESIFKRSIY